MLIFVCVCVIMIANICIGRSVSLHFDRVRKLGFERSRVDLQTGNVFSKQIRKQVDKGANTLRSVRKLF